MDFPSLMPRKRHVWKTSKASFTISTLAKPIPRLPRPTLLEAPPAYFS
jgi:hypothetical protein